MELHNTFTVPVGVEEAWRVLLDVEQLAPCMPGAAVDQVDGDEVSGRVKVKLGPIAITYRGKITFVERDHVQHRVVLAAAAQELRGSGTANARITAALHEQDGQTEVAVTTDLNVTGKPAQFGRNVMADVSERIVGEFAANLARELAAGTLRTVPAADVMSTSPPVSPAARILPADRPTSDTLDLLAVVGNPVLKRLGPVLVAVGVTLVISALVGRRRSKTRRRD